MVGADEAGSATINGVGANHYTFDQRALGEDGLTQSTGELWVATNGGYLVKYVLTRKANADYFGEGVEGTLTYDYELTDADKPAAIKLPDDCPPGLVDAPAMSDAVNEQNFGGLLAYDTPSSVADVAAYYQKQAPDLGWKLQGSPDISDAYTVLDFSRGQQTLTVIISPTEGGQTNVRALVGSPP